MADTQNKTDKRKLTERDPLENALGPVILLILHHLLGNEMPFPSAAAKSLQSCLTLCDPIDGSPPGSPVPGILQARPLEWVAISFSNAWKGKVKVKSLGRVRLLAISWTAAYQVPPSMGFFQARVLEWVAIAFSTLSLYLNGNEFNQITLVLEKTLESLL